MSLPSFDLNNNTTSFLNEIENSRFQQLREHQQQQTQQKYLQHYHQEKSMFGIPLPPPLVVPPPPLFDRNMSPPRKRTRTSPEQLIILEKSFSDNPSPNNRVREQLSCQLGMPERSIQIWFQNRRAKVKNQAKRCIKVQDSTLYMQQQYAASAAAAACQSAAFQLQQDAIDPNLYYYYYYYYFHQQQQQLPPSVSAPTDDNKNAFHSNQMANVPMPPPPPPPPAPSSSFSTPTSSWSSNHQNTSMTPPIVPDLTLSASTSSSSITSDNHHISRRRHHNRSSSASVSSERTRAHSVGPYPYYRKSTPQERHSSMGPPPTAYTSIDITTPSNTPSSNNNTNINNDNDNDSSNNTPSSATSITSSHPMLFCGTEPSGRLYTSTILEEPYRITPSVKHPRQKYELTAQTLQIGSWKRVCDLNCHLDLATRRLTWCIGDDQQRFCMNINLNLVQFIRVHRSSTTNSYRLEFFLSSPNQVGFFMTNIQRNWVQCHDFTQDRQASLENVHVLEDFSQLLETQFMEILMQAPDLQSLVIEDEDDHQESNTLYHHKLCNSSQSLLLDDTTTVPSSTDDSIASNLLLLQGLHLPQQ